MVKYFISYSYQAGNVSGFGNLENHRSEEIKDIYDIQSISRSIEMDFGYTKNSVVIINYVKIN